MFVTSKSVNENASVETRVSGLACKLWSSSGPGSGLVPQGQTWAASGPLSSLTGERGTAGVSWVEEAQKNLWPCEFYSGVVWVRTLRSQIKLLIIWSLWRKSDYELLWWNTELSFIQKPNHPPPKKNPKVTRYVFHGLKWHFFLSASEGGEECSRSTLRRAPALQLAFLF